VLAAEIEPAQPVLRRRSLREPVSLAARIDRDGLRRALCKIVDLSVHGARLQTYTALRRRSVVLLTLPVIGVRSATIVWADDFLAGCQFMMPLSDDEFETLLDLDETLRRD
jgi:hypothetical protein